MTSCKGCVTLPVVLYSALVLGVSTLAANEPQPRQQQTPLAAKIKLPEPIKIMPGVRRIVTGTTPGPGLAQRLKPTDLVCSIGASYDEAGNQLISPPGSSSGTYSAAKAAPRLGARDGEKHRLRLGRGRQTPPPTFSVRVLFVYPVMHILNFGYSHVTRESQTFSYVEQLQPDSAYQYKFHFHPGGYKLPNIVLENITGYTWHNLDVSVALDPRNLVRESKADRMNNNCSYKVNFTD